MVNPALYLVVFYVVFVIIMPNGIPSFPIFLLSGLLVWNLFSAALGGGTGAIVANAAIVKKVSFPREILPLAAVGSALVHFFLQAIVLFAALVVARYEVAWSYMPLLVPALLTVLLLAAALAVLLSAVNVNLRDTAHLLELALLGWFWFTPIVWPFRTLSDNPKLDGWEWVLWLNPVTPIVLAFQRAIYNKTEVVNGGVVSPILPEGGPVFYLWHVGIVFGAAAVLFVLALSYFGRVEGDFAEEL
jgi:ABC-2 type transport system permease protein